MSEMPSRRRAAQGGFTLIELLVVVLIIGILASIAIPAFLGQRRKAQDVSAKSLIRSGLIATESYYTDNQTFNLLAPTLLAGEEQNIDWVDATSTDPNPDAIQQQLRVDVYGTSPNEDSYVMYTASKTGAMFSYIRTSNGASYRCSGAAAPTSATGPCTGTYAGGW